MRSSREEFSSRQAPPEQSFTRRDAIVSMDGPRSDFLPPHLQPQHHQLSPETPPIGGAHIFALFYSLIFSVVHAVLTMVFAPVLGNGSNGRNQTPAAVRCESSHRSLSPPRESDGNITVGSEDPELAMVEINRGGGGDGPSSYHNPIVNSQSLASSSRSNRSCGGSGNCTLSAVDENKVARFPGQGRIRPPLGRIERLPSCSSGSSSSSTSTSSSRGGGRREQLVRPISQQLQTSSSSRSFRRSGPVPRTSSPFSRITSPRMAHSTYFLE